MGDSANWSYLLATPPSYASQDSPDLVMCVDSFSQPEHDYVIPQEELQEIFPAKEQRIVPITSQQIQSSPAYGTSIQPFQNQCKDFGDFENRSLLVTNVHPETTKQEIIELFDPYDSIKSIDMSLIGDGLCTVEYYDLRHANNLKRIANGATLHGNVIIVAYAALPRLNDSKKPPNNGTIVVFHLPMGVTDKQIETHFGQFGEIKQIRGTPSKPTQRFIEYWDTRSAEDALNGLSGKQMMGSKLSIEFSLPGGSRKNALKQDHHAPRAKNY